MTIICLLPFSLCIPSLSNLQCVLLILHGAAKMRIPFRYRIFRALCSQYKPPQNELQRKRNLFTSALCVITIINRVASRSREGCLWVLPVSKCKNESEKIRTRGSRSQIINKKEDAHQRIFSFFLFYYRSQIADLSEEPITCS